MVFCNLCQGFITSCNVLNLVKLSQAMGLLSHVLPVSRPSHLYSYSTGYLRQDG